MPGGCVGNGWRLRWQWLVAAMDGNGWQWLTAVVAGGKRKRRVAGVWWRVCVARMRVSMRATSKPNE